MLVDRKLAGGAFLGVTIAVGTMVGASALRGSGNDDAVGGRTLLTGADALSVGCQPPEAAVIQEFEFRGEKGVNSRCVIVSESMSAAPAGELAPVPSSRLMPAAYQAQPAVLTSPAPAVVPAAAPVTRQAPRRADSARTWKKTALIIGGSTAAGAGVGGVIGGKKGALIGAAIGGGGSTIYEAMKRR